MTGIDHMIEVLSFAYYWDMTSNEIKIESLTLFSALAYGVSFSRSAPLFLLFKASTPDLILHLTIGLAIGSVKSIDGDIAIDFF